MGDKTMAKCIFERVLNGNTVLVNATTPPGTLEQQATYVKSLVDGKAVDNKFWWWPTIPSGKVIGCDFTNAPQIQPSPDNTIADVQALMGAITATPESVLTYE